MCVYVFSGEWGSWRSGLGTRKVGRDETSQTWGMCQLEQPSDQATPVVSLSPKQRSWL